MLALNSLHFEVTSLRMSNIEVQPGIIIDDAALDGNNIQVHFGPHGDGPVRIATDDVRFRCSMSEPHLNALLDALLPGDAPVRGLRVAVFSGRLEFKGQFVKSVLSLPFSLDATPKVENGNRIVLDCRSARASGLGLPPAVVEVVEKVLNDRLTLDLSGSPIPVWLDEIRCEPGRLTISGRGKIEYPFPDRLPPRASLDAATDRQISPRLPSP